MGRGDPDEELLVLFALDALEGEERDEVERAVASSPELAARVEAHRSTAAAVAQSVAEAPPPDLKQRVLDAAFAESPPRAAAGGDAPSVVVDFARRRPSAQRLRWIGVAAGLAAALLVGVFVAGRNGADVPTARVALSGPAGTLQVTVEDGRRIELSSNDIDPLPADKIYELWLVNPDQTVRAAGVFAPRVDGSVDVELTLDVEDAAAMAVTLEPPGGAPTDDAPTGPIVLQGSFT